MILIFEKEIKSNSKTIVMYFLLLKLLPIRKTKKLIGHSLRLS